MDDREEEDDDRSGLILAGLLLLGLFALAFKGGGRGSGSGSGPAIVEVTGSTCTVDGTAVPCDSVAERVRGRAVVLRVIEGSQGIVEALIADLELAGISYAIEME